MKIKNKLYLGFGFLFIVVIFNGLLSLFYINRVTKSARLSLKDNYQTLSYVRQMRSILDEGPLILSIDRLKKFDTYLIKEKNNITEPGEREAVAELEVFFHLLVSQAQSIKVLQNAQRSVRSSLQKIEALNMNAIVRKYNTTQGLAQRANILLGLVGAITFLILFSFSVNFPNFISDPLRKLQDGIVEISQKNYSTRLSIAQNDEFADVVQAFNSMANRLMQWENSNLANILSNKQRIEAIIEQMKDAIIGVDEKQEILFINSEAKKLLNFTDKKMEGQRLDIISKDNDLFKAIIQDDSNGKPFKIAMYGKELYYRLEIREINVPQLNQIKSEDTLVKTESAGKVFILQNITEFQERDQAKINFIATISHELKIQASSIRMGLKLLNDVHVRGMNEEQKQLIKHLEDDANRFLNIISEFLELSRVETGNIELNLVATDPMQIVNYAVTFVQPQADQNKVVIDITYEKQLPKLQVDVEKTGWVLVNFLSNALRYSPEKSKVIIEVKEYGNMVEFSVTDSGKGIDEQFQKRLFDRYLQVPTDGHNKSGSGFGLAISKDFIEAQQGQIGVKSALGEGSRFYFRLPITKT